MADDPKAGETTSEGAGAPAGDEPRPEATPGATNGNEGEGQDAREQYIERLEAAARKAEEVIARLTATSAAPAAPAANPPTAGRGEVAELEREAQAIAAERERIDAALRRDGATAEHLIAHNKLTTREARFYATLNAKALELSDTERAVENAGTEKEWREFARQNPGVDLTILRDAFLKRQQDAKPPEKPKTPARPAPAGEPPARPVNVSGSSEVTAPDKKARTITSEDWAARKRELIAKNDFDTLNAEAAAIRSGDTILK